MRRSSAALLATTFACLAALAAAAAARAPERASARRCFPSGATVLARDRYVWIYRTRARRAGEPAATMACLAGHTGHITLLAPTRLNLRSSLGPFELAGRVAAYLETEFGVDSGTTQLVVVDIGARRVLRSTGVGQYVDAGLIRSDRVVRFVVTPRGSVAWSLVQTEHRQQVGVSIYAAPREGAPALLEAGADIDPGSLSLAGRTVRWTRAGTARAVPMP
jgi:hypothetical protein